MIKLVAFGLGLSGLMPNSTIGKLNRLESLDLSNNKITSLPSDFWSLSSLKTLNPSSNQISETLPSNIGNLGLLETLDLSNNNFSRNIPEDISSLVSLQVLKLNGNRFNSRIPLWMISTTYLNISQNLYFMVL